MSQSVFPAHPDQFKTRHIGPTETEQKKMLAELGISSVSELMDQTIPSSIRTKNELNLAPPLSEEDALQKIRALAQQNQVYRSYIGMGYVGTITPKVILRNVLENPGWYTQYTPYQAEIAQGRLEALLNFQTMIIDLTGLEIANASLLDEATAAAEAMAMAFAIQGKDPSKKFFVADDCHPQTLEVVKTRAKYMGISLEIAAPEKYGWTTPLCGALFQYPNTYGVVSDLAALTAQAKKQGAITIAACDLMGLLLLKSPGEIGFDMAVGNSQSFGVPLGYGGPHAAFLATRDAYKRQMPGRIVGLSKDTQGNPAIRLALQTREQHIRRDKATSNICTAQVLLAIMASMYAVYHGPERLKAIAARIHAATGALANALSKMGLETSSTFFNTLKVDLKSIDASLVHAAADRKRINFRPIDGKTLGITLDESVSETDLFDILSVFAEVTKKPAPTTLERGNEIPAGMKRTSAFLTHPVFNSFHSETEMLRYITRLQSKDLSLAQSMIPLGSCTMKLNATAEMIPVSWPEFSQIHPFVPENQAKGYRQLLSGLEEQLAEITGFPGISLQPNAGSQGEYAGLLVIRKYQEDQGQGHRDICLIPSSAHGTNPASAAMAGMKVVVVACDAQGNVDVEDLKRRAAEHSRNLSALMVTYPSTHGVFEEKIQEICEIVHGHGGQVYMDGANMNAQVGLTKPGEFGPDVCHLNLHKTFCIPHGGGGPGMGPIGVKAHLRPYLPSHPVVRMGGEKSFGVISAAPWGSPSILPISYLYIQMMGSEGLRQATQVAILNANYVARRLSSHYPVLYSGKNGLVAHECIIDLRPIKDTTGVEVEDVAKRLMDYGFHAPTISFPVPGTMMIEPTESESKAELDRFIHAMVQIREEIREIESGKADRRNNVLKNAPHTARMVTGTRWDYPYSREIAAFPTTWVKESKFWPAVSRIDNVYGERNLVCACPPLDAYAEPEATL